MNRTISAIFENGLFRPTEPVGLTDGARVELTVRTDDAAPSNGSALEALSRMASMPIEGETDAFSGADQDSILYGKYGAR